MIEVPFENSFSGASYRRGVKCRRDARLIVGQHIRGSARRSRHHYNYKLYEDSAELAKRSQKLSRFQVVDPALLFRTRPAGVKVIARPSGSARDIVLARRQTG